MTSTCPSCDRVVRLIEHSTMQIDGHCTLSATWTCACGAHGERPIEVLHLP